MSTTTTKDRMRTLLNALKAQDRMETAESTFQTEVAAQQTYTVYNTVYYTTWVV